MSAYVIVDVDVHDPERYAEYVQIVPAVVAQFGGKYLARGGRTENLEGGREPKRVVLLEFPSFAQAQAWWNSQEYQLPKSLRRSASHANIILVEGVPPS